MTQEELNQLLLETCWDGDLEKVKYLLTSPALKEHANIHYKGNKSYNALIATCHQGHLDIVKYLLTSSELAEHANINSVDKDDWNAFMYACNYRHFNIVEYLLLEYNMSVDNKTTNWLEKNNHHNIIQMIESRDLYNKIQDKIEPKSSTKQKKI